MMPDEIELNQEKEYRQWQNRQLRHVIGMALVIFLATAMLACWSFALILGFLGQIVDKPVAGPVTIFIIAGFVCFLALMFLMDDEPSNKQHS